MDIERKLGIYQGFFSKKRQKRFYRDGKKLAGSILLNRIHVSLGISDLPSSLEKYRSLMCDQGL